MAETDGRSLDDDIARAVAAHEGGRLEDAAVAYRRILAAAPDRHAVRHNLGVALAQSGRPAEALAEFDRVIAAEPDYVHALVNRGGALEALHRLGDAAEAYGRALAVQPELYPVQLRRGLTLLADGRRADALSHFRKTHALRRDEGFMGADHASFTRTSRLKIAHDAAQFSYLAEGGVDPARFAALADDYDAALADIAWPDDPAVAVDLPVPWRDRLADSYNKALHIADAPEMPSALGSWDGAEVERAYAEDGPGIAAIDELLSPPALTALRRYLLESTIWYDHSHIGGFLAAYLEDGLACPVLLQVADELRTRLPAVLGTHPLRQGWAFKGLTGDKGIDVHADAGAVSVNFWATPDTANREPGKGGLVIHRVEPPAGWALSDYHDDVPRIRRMLSESDAGAATVPYGENRAVLFRSGLFHESDAVRFGPRYEDHRINITLLFGDPAENARL